MPVSKNKASGYDAFSAVDSLVSKPVLGSDGAAQWQDFQASTKYKSRGVAPHIPLKKTDKISGMKSVQDERKHEQQIRELHGDRDMGSGYTLFKRKNTQEEAAERKRRKLILERKRPDDALYFIKADTFEGWKEDYIFTTRDGNTGYYWDGTDSIKKLEASVATDSVQTSLEATLQELPRNKKTKKKKPESLPSRIDSSIDDSDLPAGWASAMDPTTNKVYYYNITLNKTMWEKPTNAENKQFPTDLNDAVDKLPDGWEEAVDPSTGKTYYYNRSFNKTSWIRPT